ncbi:hypothetical protein EYF80_013519 [Liparis tanakae]|uniref:Uncharacterized protein n=1 Tax=Liparis tanakae TaxID=230148 RepID=A0A4Z2IEP0_9TELE|nr:hypothetical protein EYF80_013519 [Liparis tanakae]
MSAHSQASTSLYKYTKYEAGASKRPRPATTRCTQASAKQGPDYVNMHRQHRTVSLTAAGVLSLLALLDQPAELLLVPRPDELAAPPQRGVAAAPVPPASSDMVTLDSGGREMGEELRVGEELSVSRSR